MLDEMTVVSKLSKSPSTTVDNRQRRMEVGTTALRGGLYKCTGGECEGVVQGPSRLDYTLVLASVMVVLCACERPFAGFNGLHGPALCLACFLHLKTA